MKVLTSLFLMLCFYATTAFTTPNVEIAEADDMMCDPTGCYDMGGPLEIVWICDANGQCDPHDA